jgi:hypothetical protein
MTKYCIESGFAERNEARVPQVELLARRHCYAVYSLISWHLRTTISQIDFHIREPPGRAEGGFKRYPTNATGFELQ